MDKDLSYYQQQATLLLDEDRNRNLMFNAMDEMYRNEWKIPSALSNLDWVHKVVDTGPHDALGAAARVLSTVDPKITYYPLDTHPETRERCNKIEKALAWHYKRASRRSIGSVTRDIVMSALRYDEVALQVIYLPWQRKISKELRGRMWDTGGDFALIVHNPRDVHVKRSVYGVEGVLLQRNIVPDDLVALWGDKGRSTLEEIAKSYTNSKSGKSTMSTQDIDEFTYYDWTDNTNRVVWVDASEKSNQNDTGAVSGGGSFLVFEGEHKLRFIPWVSRMGGTALDSEPEYQRHPLLASIYWAGQWETVNTLRTLEMSKAISTAAAPMSKSTSTSGEAPDVDYTTPGGNVPLKPGEDYIPLPPPQLDPRLRELTQQMVQAIGSSTVPRILQSAEFPSGAAFSSLNTMLRSASAVLDPFRKTAELALADVFTQMLLWLIQSKSPLFAYDNTSRASMGMEIKVDPKTIAPEDIYIDVELSATLPLDKMSELNAASTYVERLGLSKERALEMLDHTDASELIEEGIQEAFVQAQVQNRLKMVQAEIDLRIQKMQLDMQNQAQVEAMQAQQAAQQPPPQPEGMPPEAAQAMQQQGAQQAAGLSPEQQMGAFGQVFPGGEGFNPAEGGQPPMMAAPGVTKEVINQRGMNGEPTANI